jgi:hypothetical protein
MGATIHASPLLFQDGIDAAGVYVRWLTKDEQEVVARRLANEIAPLA